MSKAVLAWYRVHGRQFPWRGWTDPYRVVVTEVLLQRTRADVVASFVGSFISRYPSWQALADAQIPELELLLTPIGLQRRRASSLLSLAKAVVRGGDNLDWGSLPGVGQYIHRAVAVATRGERAAMVDTNFVRIIQRAFGPPWKADYRYDARMQRIAAAFVEDVVDPARTNWSVLDLGALVCTPRAPNCGSCPLAPECCYGAKARPPVPSPFLQPNGHI